MVDRSKPVLFGVDRAGVIRPHELAPLRDVVGPVDWIAVYIGGPRNGGRGWDRAAVQDLANAQPGVGFLPIYVGLNAPWDVAYGAGRGQVHGAEAVALTEGFGLDLIGGPLCLDVEHETWGYAGVRDYVLAWCEEVSREGYTPVVYGPTGLCAWLQETLPHVKTWAAYWPSSGDTWVRLQGAARPMLNLTVGGLLRTPDAWQFVGSAPVIGGIDANVSRGDFPLCELAVNDVPLPEPPPLIGEDDLIMTQELRAELDSLAGSVGELYARIGAVETALSRDGVAVAETVPAEPEPLAELAPNELRAWQGDTLPVIAGRYGRAGGWGALLALNEAIGVNDAIPEGAIVTVPEAWVRPPEVVEEPAPE